MKMAIIFPSNRTGFKCAWELFVQEPIVYSTFGNQSFGIASYVYFVPTQNPNYSTQGESIYINKGETLTYLVDFN